VSFYDYQVATRLAKDDEPFYALIMAAMWKADSDNVVKLREAFPDTWHELERRYHAPGGILEIDKHKGEENQR
jgi:hypothetical protein